MLTLGFSKKIVLASSAIIAISLFTLSFFNYKAMMETTQGLLQKNIHETSSIAAFNISKWLNSKLDVVKVVANTTKIITPNMEAPALAMLKAADNLSSLYIAGEDGSLILANKEFEVPTHFDPRERIWYTGTKSNQAPYFTPPYIGIKKQKLLITLTAPIINSGKFIGVAGGDLPLSYIAETLEKINFSGVGSAYLVNADGDILVHTNSDLNGNNIKQVYDNDNIKIEEKLQQVELNDKGKLITFYRINNVESVNWFLAVQLDKKAAFSEINEMKVWSIILTLTAILTSILLINVLLNKLMQPLHSLRSAFANIAQGNGDLTQRLTLNGNDEIAQLAGYFNTFVATIHDMMKGFKAQSEHMNSIAMEMDENTAKSKQDLEKRHQNTEHVASAVASMSSTADDIAVNAQNASFEAQGADTESTMVTEVVDGAILSIQGLATNLQNAEEVISDLEEEVLGISSVLEVIESIADQTNLLALNAAIEAARAGDQGRGFAVVADEVRSLAGKTQESTEVINAKIISLQSGTRRAVEVMIKSKAISAESVEKAAEAGSSLQMISQRIAKISDINEHIAKASSLQTEQTEDIARSVIRISDETAKAANASAKTTDGLINIGHDINNEVNKFVI